MPEPDPPDADPSNADPSNADQLDADRPGPGLPLVDQVLGSPADIRRRLVSALLAEPDPGASPGPLPTVALDLVHSGRRLVVGVHQLRIRRATGQLVARLGNESVTLVVRIPRREDELVTAEVYDFEDPAASRHTRSRDIGSA